MKLLILLGGVGMALAVATVLLDPANTPMETWVAMGGMFGASGCALAIGLGRGRRPSR